MAYSSGWMARDELAAPPMRGRTLMPAMHQQDGYRTDDDDTPRGYAMGGLMLPTVTPGSGCGTPIAGAKMADAPYDFEEDSVRTPRTTEQHGYNATWARLRTPSPVKRSVQETEKQRQAAARVEWRNIERGLPVLPRAWRTPDPSPHREGGEVLPAARLAELAFAETEAMESKEDEPWARVRTPSPESHMPPPPMLPGATKRPTTPRGQTEEASEGNVEPPPSAGSCGHPHQCGAPCKYFWKASGCKDGAACERCHLCKWVRPRKKAEAAPTPVAPPKPMTLQIATAVAAKPRPRDLPLLRLSEMVF